MPRRPDVPSPTPTIGSVPVMTGLLFAASAAAPLVLAQAATTPTTSLADACGASSTTMCKAAYDAWGAGTAEFVNVFDQPIEVVVIIVVAFVVNRLARTLIKRSMTRVLSDRSGRTRQAIRKATPNVLLRTEPVNLRLAARVQTLTTVLRSIASVIIWFIAALAVLGALGINLTTLVAPASILGVALGFGAQNIVKDFLAGIFIVIEDQFGVGDVVDIGGDAKGTVEQLTLRATRVRDVHGTVWHVPNGQILRAANKSQEWARALLDIEVDGSTDYDRVAGVVRHVAESVAADPRWMVEIMETPELWGVESFTEKGYTVRLVVKTRPASQFGVMRELRIRLLAAFREAEIILPGGQWSTEHHEALREVQDERAAPSAPPPLGPTAPAPAPPPPPLAAPAPASPARPAPPPPPPAPAPASAAVRPVENETESDDGGHVHG
jgi:small-conductance mechanosensitive channel